MASRFYSLLKLLVVLGIGLLFGPILAIYFSFFGDIYTLSLKYKFLSYITDEWELLLVFGLFWTGIYFLLVFTKLFKKFTNMPPKLDWWQREVIYQIYINSFYDSNNDGIGDFGGIMKKLDYLKEIGINAIWLTPCFPSGGLDGGYDITNFKDVDPIYGNMDEFDRLVDMVHKKNMYILLDFVPNHTSDQHPWFVESKRNNKPDNPFRDFYVWYPSNDSVNPPNNWRSIFGGPSWTYCESRKAWYLHQFLPQQPDLNFRCPEVRKEILNVLRFWLDEHNVDGFRIDALKHLYESDKFENDPFKPYYLSKLNTKEKLNFDKLTYNDLDHPYTANLPETFETVYEWRLLCNEISAKKNKTKVLVAEASYDVKDIAKYYRYNGQPNVHFALNMQLFQIKYNKTPEQFYFYTFRPYDIKLLIDEYQNGLEKGSWTNWATGNHDMQRAATRFGIHNINLGNALNLLLGGTATVYYGEEIGMTDLPKEKLSFEDCKDGAGLKLGPKEYLQGTRDFQRTPMQWDDSYQAGFTTSKKPWLPLNSNYTFLNVKNQLKTDKSYLKIFQDLLELRKQPSFQWGSLDLLVAEENVFSFTRRAYDFPVYLVVMNLTDKSTRVNLLVNNNIAPRAYVAYYISGDISVIANVHDEEKHLQRNLNASNGLVDKYKKNAPVLTKNVELNGHDCLILTWPSSD